jgi:hypothetical protein
MKINQDNLKKYYVYHEQRVLALLHKMDSHKYPELPDNQTVLTRHFCNIDRKLDRGTVFIIDRVVRADLTEYDRALNLFMYRLFNCPIVADRYILRFPIDFRSFDNFNTINQFNDFETEVGGGKRIQSSAYFLSSSRKAVNTHLVGSEYRTLNSNTKLALFVRYHYEDILLAYNANTASECVKILMRIPGVGSFIAGQIMVDFAYCEATKFDLYEDFVSLGPGSRAGLSWLYSESTSSPLDQYRIPETEFIEMINNLHNDVLDLDKMDHLLLQVTDYVYEPTNWTILTHTQNSLCEFAKFMRYENKIKSRNRLYNSY